MNLKYIVMPEEDVAFGIQWSSIREECAVGGLSRFEEILQQVSKSAFERKQLTLIQMCSNKIRFVFPCDRERLKKGLERLRKFGYIVQQRASLGRMMY